MTKPSTVPPVAGPQVDAHIPVTHPQQPGTWLTAQMFVDTPAGTFGGSYRVWRNDGPGMMCFVTHHMC